MDGQRSTSGLAGSWGVEADDAIQPAGRQAVSGCATGCCHRDGTEQALAYVHQPASYSGRAISTAPADEVSAAVAATTPVAERLRMLTENMLTQQSHTLLHIYIGAADYY